MQEPDSPPTLFGHPTGLYALFFAEMLLGIGNLILVEASAIVWIPAFGDGYAAPVQSL